MKRNKLNIEELEKRIRQDFGIVTWTSAKINGTRLEIQIRENEVEMSTEREGEEEKGETQEEFGKNPYGSDLVAEEDGVIVSMVHKYRFPLKNP